MHYIVKWFTPIITIGVIIFIILFLLKINAPIKLSNAISLSKKVNRKIDKFENNSWIINLKKNKQKSYFYPVNEIFIHADLSNEMIHKKNYKVLAHISTLYQFFCLREELREEKIKYFLKNNNNMVELLVYSRNQKKLNFLIKTLKTYNIKAVISPLKKENQWKKVQL